MTIPKPVLPKEHGLWVWVLLPLCVGAGAAAGAAGNFLFVFAAVICWFMALTPARMVYKNRKKGIELNRAALYWSAVFGSLGTVAAALSLWADYRLAAFFAFFAPAFYFGVRAAYAGFQKSLGFEFGGIVYLSFLSLMGAFSVAGDFETMQLAVWGFVLIFLLDRSAQTRMLARTMGGRGAVSGETLKTVCRRNIFLSFAAIAAVSVVLTLFALPRAFLVPYLPGIAVTLFHYIRPPGTLRRVGYAELALAIIFAVLFVLITKSGL
jgi:hypothetical protein